MKASRPTEKGASKVKYMLELHIAGSSKHESAFYYSTNHGCVRWDAEGNKCHGIQ